MRLSKHHGLGNDFLVLLDAAGTAGVTPALARALCHRRRGIGADGLLWATAGTGGTDVTMQLRNADGSGAEMSGNGIACLAQAVVLAGWAPLERVVVGTDAGIRVVAGGPGPGPRSHRMRVDMGAAVIGAPRPDCVDGDIRAALEVHMGNPHLVLLGAGPGAGADLAERGRMIDERAPGGINVEVVTAGPGPGELAMAVYERGVGITAACGTGACAAASAASAWGLTGPAVTVHSAGGSSSVTLGAVVQLGTIAVHVADVEVGDDPAGDFERGDLDRAGDLVGDLGPGDLGPARLGPTEPGVDSRWP